MINLNDVAVRELQAVGVEPNARILDAVRHIVRVARIDERSRVDGIIHKYSLTQAQTLGDIRVCDELLTLLIVSESDA